MDQSVEQIADVFNLDIPHFLRRDKPQEEPVHEAQDAIDPIDQHPIPVPLPEVSGQAREENALYADPFPADLPDPPPTLEQTIDAIRKLGIKIKKMTDAQIALKQQAEIQLKAL